jgi:hypothetical protein
VAAASAAVVAGVGVVAAGAAVGADVSVSAAKDDEATKTNAVAAKASERLRKKSPLFSPALKKMPVEDLWRNIDARAM